MKPQLCLYLGPTAGWALRLKTGGVRHGAYNLRANPLIDVMDDDRAHWWLGDIRFEVPFFSVVAVVDPPKPFSPRFERLLGDWIDMTKAFRERITPRQLKRATVGPYCTRRELAQWAKGYYGAHVTEEAHAFALAGLECLPKGQ